jgi:hypothetical protein
LLVLVVGRANGVGTMIFSGPLQPALLGAGIASAKVHLSDEIDDRQRALSERIDLFNSLCAKRGIPPRRDIEEGDGFQPSPGDTRAFGSRSPCTSGSTTSAGSSTDSPPWSQRQPEQVRTRLAENCSHRQVFRKQSFEMQSVPSSQGLPAAPVTHWLRPQRSDWQS